MAEQKPTAQKGATADDLKPQTLNINHQDSIFGAPITYESPAEGEVVAVDEKKEREKEEDRFLQEELPPISYQLQSMYKSTHPEYTMKF